MHYKDISGQRFGMLTAMEYRGSAKWLFKCDCGNERVIQKSLVEKGFVKSCGCRKIKDIIGHKFHKLTAIRKISNQIWEFECECGKHITSDRYAVTSGKTQSCGCGRSIPRQNLVGRRFGLLTVISYVNKQGWKCKCDCGNVVVRTSGSLKIHENSSCGCIASKFRFMRKHGLSDTVEYHSWRGLVDRCINPESQGYHLYGGRGIRVCERWLGEKGFENFLADMGERPSPKHSIDRIDVNGDYCPENCRWADTYEQANNKRNNHRISYQGETLTLAEWSRRTGLHCSTLGNRLKRGLSLDKVFYQDNLNRHGNI